MRENLKTAIASLVALLFMIWGIFNYFIQNNQYQNYTTVYSSEAQIKACQPSKEGFRAGILSMPGPGISGGDDIGFPALYVRVNHDCATSQILWPGLLINAALCVLIAIIVLIYYPKRRARDITIFIYTIGYITIASLINSYVINSWLYSLFPRQTNPVASVDTASIYVNLIELGVFGSIYIAGLFRWTRHITFPIVLVFINCFMQASVQQVVVLATNLNRSLNDIGSLILSLMIASSAVLTSLIYRIFIEPKKKL